MRTSQLLGAGILYVAFLRVQLLTRSSYASEVCGNGSQGWRCPGSASACADGPAAAKCQEGSGKEFNSELVPGH